MTSGVVGPILLKPVLPGKFHMVFIVLKQFGTGVIIATAFVHVSAYETILSVLLLTKTLPDN